MTVLALLALTVSAAAAPDWVDTGRSARFPRERFLTAVASAESLESAKTAAAGELARSISVRIESQMSDLMTLKNGVDSQEIAVFSRASSDVRLTGLTYETFQKGERAHALAVLERAVAGAEERRLRGAAVAELKGHLSAAEAAQQAGRESDALKALLAARTALAEALRHDTLARVLERAAAGDDDGLAGARAGIEEKIAALLRRPQTNLREAAEALAFQLRQQGMKAGRLTIAPFTYRTTIYPSVFGRAAAAELERALSAGAAAQGNELVLKGTYVEDAEAVRLVVVAREAATGRAAGSAEARVPLKAIPADLPLTPPNLMQALRDQKILAEGEEVGAGLRVELFTNKHDAVSGSQVFSEGEELKLFVRVNKPAYVRLVYLLQNGARVPLAQAWYVKEGDVNKLLEFTDSFEIAPPFGSEHVHAVAFTEKPPELPVRKEVIEGVEYETVANGTSALVGHRGLVKKKKAAETAEALVTITTMPAMR